MRECVFKERLRSAYILVGTLSASSVVEAGVLGLEKYGTKWLSKERMIRATGISFSFIFLLGRFIVHFSARGFVPRPEAFCAARIPEGKYRAECAREMGKEKTEGNNLPDTRIEHAVR